MATLHVSVCRARLIAGAGASQVIYDGAPVIAAALTTSGTAASTTTLAAATTTTKQQQGTLVARCGSVDSDHYVRVSGTASATNAYYVPMGSWIEIAIGPGLEISAVTV
jgi:hypothetical protein